MGESHTNRRISVHQALGAGPGILLFIFISQFNCLWSLVFMHNLTLSCCFLDAISFFRWFFFSVADVLLWRKRCGSIALLVSSTSLWILFERAGYNPLTFVANVLLLLVVILFFWAKSASLLNRYLFIFTFKFLWWWCFCCWVEIKIWRNCLWLLDELDLFHLSLIWKYLRSRSSRRQMWFEFGLIVDWLLVMRLPFVGIWGFFFRYCNSGVA